MMTTKISALQNRIKGFVEDLAAQTVVAKDSAQLMEYLKFAAAFHNYSVYNCCLIYSQMETATHVAGFRTWKKLGRSVKKGEKGIAILAPIFSKVKPDEDDKDEKVITRFRPVYVFDVSQTEGDDLPEAPVLTGDACNEDLVLALTLLADDKGISVRTEAITGGAMGLSKGGIIVIDDSLEGADRFAVLAHEVGHEFLKHKDRHQELGRKQREIEAESVAWTVCQYFNVPCTAPNYLALYGADSKEIMTRLESIVGAIQQIISGIEAHLVPLQQAANG